VCTGDLAKSSPLKTKPFPGRTCLRVLTNSLCAEFLTSQCPSTFTIKFHYKCEFSTVSMTFQNLCLVFVGLVAKLVAGDSEDGELVSELVLERIHGSEIADSGTSLVHQK